MLQVRRILWAAMAFSTVIYFAMIFFITRDQPLGSYEDALRKPLVLPLYAAALLLFLVTMFALGKLKLGNVQTAMIVRLALFEAVAIFGLVAAFVAHDWRLYLAPWALALMGMMREWPSET